MGEDAFAKLQGEDKKLVIISDANHADLYVGGNPAPQSHKRHEPRSIALRSRD